MSTESEREQVERELNCAVRQKALDTRDSGDDPLYLVAMDMGLKLRAAEKALQQLDEIIKGALGKDGGKEYFFPWCAAEQVVEAALAEIRRK